MTTKTAAQRLEDQLKKLDDLRTRHARAQAKLEAEREKLQDAKIEASLEYGVDDVPALRALRDERDAANEAMLGSLESATAAVETELSAVEKQLAQ